MTRWLLPVSLTVALAACGSFDGRVAGDPSREVIGVVTHQPSSGDARTASPDAAARNDWRVSQICTNGYNMLRQDVEPGEADTQFIDWQLRCRPYGLNAFGVSFAGLVPSWPGGQ
jgi:hypothetical protein